MKRGRTLQGRVTVWEAEDKNVASSPQAETEFPTGGKAREHKVLIRCAVCNSEADRKVWMKEDVIVRRNVWRSRSKKACSQVCVP